MKDELEEDEEIEDEGELRKMKRVHEKLDQFMEEVTPDLVDEATLAKVEKKVLRIFRDQKITPTLANLTILSLGFEFGMSSFAQLQGNAMVVNMGIKHMVSKRRKDKPNIDITQSKPL